MVKDLWWRALIKTGTWRVIAFFVLGLITYLTTGSLVLATTIALADWIAKSVLYFLHELAWSRLKFGRRVTSCKRGAVVWFTGLSGAGKTTVADAVKAKLEAELLPVKRIDGDIARRTFSQDLGFSKEDRRENCRRATHVASYLKESSIVLASFISPSPEMREYVHSMCGEKDTFIIHVDCPITECAARDPKGMYAQIKDGKFMGNPFTGVHKDAPYVEPQHPDLVLRTSQETVEQSADRVIKMLRSYGCI